MKNFAYALILAVGIFVSQEASAAGPFGLGLIVGEPTGISAKMYLSKANAIDGAVAWSLGDNDSFHLHSNYLWHKPRAFVLDGVQIDWFYGIGVRVITWDKNDKHWQDRDEDFAIGPRVPVGLNYTFSEVPIEVFGEIALALDLIPDTDVDLDLGIGARFYF